MWKSTLLTDSYARSLVRSAINSGDLTLAKPNDEAEKHQIESIKKIINKGRSDSDALLYALLFDNIILDVSGFGGGYIYAENENPEIIDSRPIFQNISDGFSLHVQSTDPLHEAFGYTDGARHHDVNLVSVAQERVELYHLLEPYVWLRMKKLGRERITRDLMNNIMDALCANPEILDIVRKRELINRNDFVFFNGLFDLFWERFESSAINIEYFHQMISLLDTKASVAIARVQEANRLNATLPLKGITSYKNTGNEMVNDFNLKGKHDDLTVTVKVILNEFKYFPVLNSFTDVLKLREDNGFIEFRDFINKWVVAVSQGDKDTEKLLRNEIKLTNKSISKAHKCQEVGRICTYMGLPIAVVDLALGSLFGLPLTIGGVAAQMFSDSVESNAKWLLIGKEQQP